MGGCSRLDACFPDNVQSNDLADRIVAPSQSAELVSLGVFTCYGRLKVFDTEQYSGIESGMLF